MHNVYMLNPDIISDVDVIQFKFQLDLYFLIRVV